MKAVFLVTFLVIILTHVIRPTIVLLKFIVAASTCVYLLPWLLIVNNQSKLSQHFVLLAPQLKPEKGTIVIN